MEEKTPHEMMFQELREQVLNDAAADPQTKGMILVGMTLLEHTLHDLRRSADALERMAEIEAKILDLLKEMGRS